MNSYQRRLEQSSLQARAEQNALLTHPVTPYVRDLPYDTPVVPLYPAISYQVVAATQHGTSTVPCSVQDILSGDLSSFDHGHQDDIDSVTCNGDDLIFDGSIIRDAHDLDLFLSSERHFIHWSLPAHDLDRPKRKGCGFIRSSEGSIVFSACSHDRDHFIRAKRTHCWSLHCPDCMNDTALRNGARTQDRFDTYVHLVRKESGYTPTVSHWVVSPPQEFMKDAMQTLDSYQYVVRHIESQLMDCGAVGGDLVFHPWRQRADRWELSPHFHSLLFGYIDTKRFRRQNPGWVIKKIHAKQGVKSVKHTIGYLQTHCGLARVEVNPDTVDWDSLVLAHFIPGFNSGKDADYSDEDYELLSKGKGRMVGDLSDMDWLEWTMSPLSADIHHRYWGCLSYASIVKVDSCRQYRIRLCSECRSYLRVYNGFSDTIGDYVRYIVDSPVMCFARNAPAVRAFILRYKATLRENDMKLEDLIRMVPVAVTSFEFENECIDLVMPGPFAEPDSFFIERQNRACGCSCSECDE